MKEKLAEGMSQQVEAFEVNDNLLIVNCVKKFRKINSKRLVFVLYMKKISCV